MTKLLLYFRRQKTLIAAIKSLGDKLREERKQRLQWQKLSLNSLNTIREIEDSITEARREHGNRSDRILYGD